MTTPAIPASPTSGGPVPEALLKDLAAASRILVAQGVVDGFGHVSLRHPTAPNRFLMSRSLAPALVTPEDIIEYDLDSQPVNANGRSSFLERFIHSEIYKARPDINSVVHSHSPSVIPFGLVRLKMQAMFHNAAFLAQGVPVFDIREKFGATDIVVSTAAKGAALAQVLADKPVALLRAHGMVAGRTRMGPGGSDAGRRGDRGCPRRTQEACPPLQASDRGRPRAPRDRVRQLS